MESNLVIIVSDKVDSSTNRVMAYLHKFGYSVIRITPSSNIDVFNSLGIRDLLERTRAVWLRRGGLPKLDCDPVFRYEREVLLDYLYYLLENKVRCLGSLVAEFKHNKLIDLQKASSVGLDVPLSYIVNKLCQIKEVKSLHPRVDFLTKSISRTVSYSEEGKLIKSGFPIPFDFDTKEVEFFPSLIQEKVDKIVDLRVFFLGGEFYSAAIFSQKNTKTELDFRFFDKSKPNRCVPFLLPEIIEDKLRQLMRLIGLNTASIDLLLAKEGRFVFLEANPVGQYEWVSESCGFNLDKKIAEYLIA